MNEYEVGIANAITVLGLEKNASVLDYLKGIKGIRGIGESLAKHRGKAGLLGGAGGFLGLQQMGAKGVSPEATPDIATQQLMEAYPELFFDPYAYGMPEQEYGYGY